MTKSGKSTKTETGSGSDLDNFSAGPPARRIDDKAAELEQEIQSIKANFNRERFTYYFVIALLFNILIASIAPKNSMLYLSIVGCLMLLIALGKWLDFPWISSHLERWHDLFFRFCERWMIGKKPDEVEPLPPNHNENNA